MRAPNGDAGVDGMISVIAHELAEVSSNPLVNAWYAGDDPTAPTEIADLCLGLYGSGGGGGYVGKVYKDSWGNGYNVNGVKGRRFLVQWVWNPVKRRCFGPNAMDQKCNMDRILECLLLLCHQNEAGRKAQGVSCLVDRYCTLRKSDRNDDPLLV